MTNEDPWKVEAACRDAFPALEEQQIGGWLLRQSDTRTRRNNSLNPLSTDPLADELIEHVEQVFAKRNKRSVVRVLSFLTDADRFLERHNYQREGETITFGATLNESNCHKAVIRKTHADPVWLDARQKILGDTSEQISAFRSVTDMILAPTCFVERHHENQIVSIGYGTVCHGFLVFESIATASDFRGNGFAQDALLSLMAWARGHGADKACLQVEADNEPAKRLYARLGFDQLLYGYHYQAKEISSAT